MDYMDGSAEGANDQFILGSDIVQFQLMVIEFTCITSDKNQLPMLIELGILVHLPANTISPTNTIGKFSWHLT